MFETSRVQAQALTPAGKARFFTASITVHTLAIFGAVVASIASVEFPKEAPNQFGPLVLAARVELPPAAPRQAPRTQPQAAVAAPPRTQTAPAVPSQIPETVTPAEPVSGGEVITELAGAGTSGTGEGSGSPDGVAGGIGDGTGTGVASTPAEDVTYNVGGEVLPPRVLTRVTPEFPAIAARAGMKGVVVVECIIDRDGRVRDARVLHSSFAVFEASAVNAVRQWRFAPGSYRGKPVATIFNLTVTFSVSNGR